MRKCDDIKSIAASNLFPSSDVFFFLLILTILKYQNITIIERKYGDTITDEDIYGYEIEPKKIFKRAVVINP